MRTDLPILVAVGLLASVMAPTAEAQSTTSAPGAVRGVLGFDGPPSPARTTQQMSMWFDLGGGYDQNINTSGSGGAANIEGYATTAVGSVRYWRGRTTRSVEGNARVFRNDQRAGRTTATGGEVNLISNLGLGRRGGLNVALRGANESALLFGGFGTPASPTSTVDPNIDVPDVSPQQGIVNDRWYSFGGTVSSFSNWTPRQRTAAQYTQVRRRPTQVDGLDSDQRLVVLRHDWMLRGNTALLGAYRLERVSQTFPDAPDADPILTQTAEAGFRYERRFSTIRAVSTSFQAGASQVLSSSRSLAGVEGSVEPTGSFSASYTLTRRWALIAGATRSLTVLQGVSQVPFINDVASLSVNGVMARRVTVVVSGSLSQGSALGASAGAFDALGGTATLRYGFRYGALFAGYTRYEHRLRELALAPGAIPARFNQSSVRAGVTLWLPLYGAF